MKCSICEKQAVREGLCRIHFVSEKEKMFLDNSNPESLGITKWLFFMYPEHFRDRFSKEHIEVYLMLLGLYDPRYTNKLHRLRELIAFRSWAKSKTIFGFISYILTHNNQMMKIISNDNKIQEVKILERLMVIFSETGGMSEDFVVNIRDEFSTNQMIKYFYPFAIEDAKESDTGQWTRKAFKFNGAFLLGLGAGQQARGKIKGAYRPTFICHDDIYSENNIITEDSRRKIKNWFYNAANNSVDDILGKIFLVGTIVHDDTVLVECENSSTWRTLKFYPMPIVKFKELIKKHFKVDLDRAKCLLPFEEVKEEFNRIAKQIEYFRKLEEDPSWEITWKERVGLYILASKYKEAVENSAIYGFYQEYFHVTIPTELRKFNPKYFQEIPGEWSITNEFGYNWFNCKGLYEYPQIINIEFGADLASGKREGDNVALTVAGMLSDGKKFVLDQRVGKFAMRDNMEIDSPSYQRFDKIIENKNMIEKIGWIDELFRLALEYNPRIIKIGQGGGLEPTVVNETRRVFNLNGNYTNIFPRVQGVSEGSKFERIENTLLPSYETMSVYHRKGLEELEYELEFLRKAKKDDRCDSLETSFWNIQRPQKISYTLFTQEIKETKKPTLGKFAIKPTDSYDWRIN